MLAGSPRERALVRRMREPALKVLYTIPELAKITGTTRRRMECMLNRNGCKYVTSGRYRYVTLATLRDCMPEVWEGLLLYLAMRGHDISGT